MIEHPDDPLAGTNPWPVADLELLARAGERDELLEKIVSSSTGSSPEHPTPARPPWILAAAAVVVLALVGVGIWVANSDAGDETSLAASSPTPTDGSATLDPDPTGDATATDPSDLSGQGAADQSGTEVSLADAERGDVLSRLECRKAMRGGAALMWRITGDRKRGDSADQAKARIPRGVGRVDLRQLRKIKRGDALPQRLKRVGRGSGERFVLLTEVRRGDGDVVRFDEGCRVVKVVSR